MYVRQTQPEYCIAYPGCSSQASIFLSPILNERGMRQPSATVRVQVSGVKPWDVVRDDGHRTATSVCPLVCAYLGT